MKQFLFVDIQLEHYGKVIENFVPHILHSGYLEEQLMNSIVNLTDVVPHRVKEWVWDTLSDVLDDKKLFPLLWFLVKSR